MKIYFFNYHLDKGRQENSDYIKYMKQKKWPESIKKRKHKISKKKIVICNSDHDKWDKLSY